MRRMFLLAFGALVLACANATPDPEAPSLDVYPIPARAADQLAASGRVVNRAPDRSSVAGAPTQWRYGGPFTGGPIDSHDAGVPDASHTDAGSPGPNQFDAGTPDVGVAIIPDAWLPTDGSHGDSGPPHVEPVDAGSPHLVDAHVAPVDAYLAPVDAYVPPPDAYVPPVDAYVPRDAYVAPTDAGAHDAGHDAGMPDAGPPPGTVSTLVLYDIGGTYGWLGELYAVSTGNLASHFGSWTAVAARSYSCGQISTYSAVIYLGSSFDEPLPSCLLDDVAGTTIPVMWVDYNLGELVTRVGATAFASRYGFAATRLDTTNPFSSVRYHGRTLTRDVHNPNGVAIDVSDHARVTELATGVRANGTTAPWAVRSGNLTFVSEIPYSFVSEEDRVLAFEDMLFDLLAPTTPERHRALLRLEDVSPASNPAELRAIADYLSPRGIPFGVGVVSRYRDPHGFYNAGVPQNVGFADAPDVVAALRYMQSHGGTIVMHGWTHQWDGGNNPYDGVTGDDTEFFRIRENPDESFDWAGPLPEDSIPWATMRMQSAAADFRAAGLAVPTIFEFPHYAASVNAYTAVTMTMPVRWERGSYYSGTLGGGTIDHSRVIRQLFPYVVRDAYGSTVIPENLGNIEPTSWHGLPSRMPVDLIRAADRNLVVRDGVAGFFFHPFYPIEYMEQTVEGMRALGYQFVSPTSL
jgi:uncharacterized protein YdaL